MRSWQCQGPACRLKAVLIELPPSLIRLLLWSRVAGPGTHSANQCAFLALQLNILTKSFPPLGCWRHIHASAWYRGCQGRGPGSTRDRLVFEDFRQPSEFQMGNTFICFLYNRHLSGQSLCLGLPTFRWKELSVHLSTHPPPHPSLLLPMHRPDPPI